METYLTSQQHAELDFWRGLIAEVGPEYYYSYRVAEYYEKTKHFPSFLTQKGIGLDYGCGCISVFEGSSKEVYGLDPLAEHYLAMLPEDMLHLITITMDVTHPIQNNSDDKVALGNHPHGIKHYKVKLLPRQIFAIRSLFRRGWTQQRLAKRFRISNQNVSAIVNKQTWKRL